MDIINERRTVTNKQKTHKKSKEWTGTNNSSQLSNRLQRWQPYRPVCILNEKPGKHRERELLYEGRSM